MKQTLKIKVAEVMLFTVFLVCSVLAGPSHDYLYKYNLTSWDSRDGLPQSSIFSIASTPDGYMWLGTQRGLVRFDGRNFYWFDKKIAPEIPHHDIQVLFTDHCGTLWMGTRNGDILSYAKGLFHSWGLNFSLNRITSITEDTRGTLWIGTDGTGLYSVKGGLFNKEPENENTQSVHEITPFGDGILLATEDGLFKSSPHHKRPMIIHNSSVNTVTLGAGNTLYLGTDEGVFQLENGISRKICDQQNGLPDNKVQTLYFSRNRNLWIGTKTGISHFSANDLTPLIVHMETFYEKNILCFKEDLRGNIWFGTFDHLNRISNKTFTTLTIDQNLLSNSISTCFQDSSGNIWVGSSLGVNLLSITPDTIHVEQTDLLKNQKILSICEMSSGTMCFCSEGVFALRTPDGAVRNFSYKDKEKPLIARVSISDGHQGLWLGNQQGISHFDGQEFTHFNLEEYAPASETFFLHLDRSETLWIGTATDLITLRKGEFRVQRLLKSNNRLLVLSAIEEKDGSIWFGTYGNGLIYFKDGKAKQVTLKQGLYSSDVFSIVDDQQGKYWMSSNDGVYSVHKDLINQQALMDEPHIFCDHFNRENGLINPECVGGRTPSGTRLQNGILLFATIQGLAVGNPYFNKTGHASPPRTVLETVVANNNFYSPLNAGLFPPGTTNLQFTFKGIEFDSPDKVRYRYRLTGLKDEWHSNAGSTQLDIQNLPPGSYTLAICSKSNLDEWGVPVRYSFVIEPFFYQTPWFYGLSVVLFMILVFWALEFRVQSLAKARRRLLKTIDERTTELKDEKEKAECANATKTEIMQMVAHDPKNPLQHISGYTELILRKSDHPQYVQGKGTEVLKTVNQMIQLISQLLHASALDSGEIHLNQTKLDLDFLILSEIKVHKKYCERKNQDILFFPETDGNTTFLSDEEKVRAIIDNLLSNAIKFSPISGKITVTTHKKDDHILLIIKDSGPGFSENDRRSMFSKFKKLSAKPTGNENSTGYGLFIVKKLLDLLGGTIELTSKPGEGASFSVRFPIKHSIP
jgi:ligand-binding sensor domain-containing protein/signal transduction histidine kinase